MYVCVDVRLHRSRYVCMRSVTLQSHAEYFEETIVPFGASCFPAVGCGDLHARVNADPHIHFLPCTRLRDGLQSSTQDDTTWRKVSDEIAHHRTAWNSNASPTAMVYVHL